VKLKKLASPASHSKTLELKASKLALAELKSVAGQTTASKSVDRVVNRVEQKAENISAGGANKRWCGISDCQCERLFVVEKNRLAKNTQFPAELWAPKLNALGRLFTKSRDLLRFR
jgi:hypothetical protein